MSGSGTAPYWGHLPTKTRRPSEDYTQAHRRRQSLDAAVAPAPTQPRSNRASIQTQLTDAPTESTYSPLESPVASSFRGAGLAPRPPSLSYGQNSYPSELSDKRKRRSTRNQDDLLQEAARATPPAAPDVPRAPPISYRDPLGSGRNSPYTFNASGQPGPPPSAHRSMAQAKAAVDMDTDASPRHFDDDLAVRRARRAASGSGVDNGRRESARRSADAQGLDRALSSRRRDSLEPEGKRDKWADDRSPLQKLELTLDSITKEEKRARVEAAERRARERAAAAAAAQPGFDPTATSPDRPVGHQVRFRDRRPSVGQGERQRPAIADPRDAHALSIRTDPIAHGTPGEGRTVESAGRSPRSHIPVPKNRSVSETAKSDLPQRNLSFRDRAAKTDVAVPQGGDSASPDTSSPVTTPGGGIALARTGSNKLRKNPPGDPWYSKRVEAEERFPAISRAEETQEPQHTGATGVSRSRSTGSTLKKPPPVPHNDVERPVARGKQFDEYDDYEEPSRPRGFAAAIGLGRSASLGNRNQPPPAQETHSGRVNGNGVKSVKFPDQQPGVLGHHDDESDTSSQHHHFREYFHREKLQPGQGMYKPPKYLDEWKKATVGTLSGALLDITAEVPAPPETTVGKDTAWWEDGGKRRDSMSSRPQKAEAFDGEYDETQAPTRFKPALYLKCGPLLRYCGTRHEKTPVRNRSGTLADKEIWRGSIMIVTQDSESSYEIMPTLRLFVQPIDLLPPPPAELKGEQALLPEYVDPIAGLPKIGRRGETYYVRPVEHLEEAKDASVLEPDDGLFEVTRTATDFDNAPDAPGSFTSRRKRIQVDGEKLGKYKDVRGFRLHAERGCTFWRFNIEVELRDTQQRIAYRINRGPSTGFWVPARGQSMNVMFHSCNGFSLSVKPDDLSGPDPMWRDVLNTHQTQPFHVMIGGGDQIYNDAVMRQTEIFREWLDIRNPLHKHNAPFTTELQDELETFYLDRYSMWFSQGLFGLANSQIPMVNMYDDHDIIDGFGSYPDHFMRSPVFSGLGAVAFKYYMLFQHQSVVGEGEETEPSWVLGCKPGPYIQELSRSLYMSLGSDLALLAVDARTERTRDDVIREDTWKKLIDRCYAEIIKGETKHLLVLLGVPIAYPRLVWLENILTSRLMDPVKALGKAGLLGNFLNNFDGGVEVLDDLDDHWTAKNHKDERKYVIEDLQDLAADKSVRITILSGDVHLAAIGQFYSNPKLHIPKHRDFRYMPNVISSAIANTPPPDLMADILNKRNKVHHFDKETDEDMIPIFMTGVDGKPRNNKRLLPHRNWCQIRSYVPGHTPPPTPPPEDFGYTPEGTPPASRGGIFRKLSMSKQRGPSYRPDVPDEKDRSRPPVSGGIFRSFSRRGSLSGPEKRPGKLMRTLSLGRGDKTGPKRSFFGRRPSMDHNADDGGINGNWGAESDDDRDDDLYNVTPPLQRRTRPTAFEGPGGTHGNKLARMGLRGGASNAREAAEYTTGDDSYFSVTARVPHRASTLPASHSRGGDYTPDSLATPPAPRPFHRTPTGLSAKQLKKGAERYEVDVEGALDIQLNVEVNPKDPAGITVPYRLLVPKLEYEYMGEEGSEGSEVSHEPSIEVDNGNAGIEGPAPSRGGTLKRLFSANGRDKGSQYRHHRAYGE
ncbi:hypothetical protein JX265_001525 [Neoarthrinium moseri]|uniref:PhoD-like phosphatase domain-containing protein n=1 Tax=Neoarthrinium moseri TaxID=1658444 RepID=A0A9Q0ATD9_9PEZI|nr:hypothetical protein JX265_001525 [Neoarthrinium moseri]